MVSGEKLYTTTDYEAYQAQHPNRLLELIDGRVVEKVTGHYHAIIALTIGTALRLWQKQYAIVGFSGVEMSHRNADDEHNIRIPDVSFRYATEDETPSLSADHTTPDFAVEVKSPSNTFKELREKAEFYIANGAKLVWLVYPSKKLVEVYYADGATDIFKEDDVLSGGDALPNFQMTVAEIFEA